MGDQPRDARRDGVRVDTPYAKLTLPRTLTPVAALTVGMVGLLAIVWKSIDALPGAGPLVLGIALPAQLSLWYLISRVVRLVEAHPDGLMGRAPRGRRLPRPPDR